MKNPDLSKSSNFRHTKIIICLLLLTLALSLSIGEVSAVNGNNTSVYNSGNNYSKNVTSYTYDSVQTNNSNSTYKSSNVNGTNIASQSVTSSNVTKTDNVVITFDDGSESVYLKAYPIMKQYGIKGTCFINTAYIGQPGYMNLNELIELHNAGWIIANHANEHLNLTTLDQTQQIYQIQTAIDWLKNNGFGDGAYYFATPYGSYDDALLDVLRQLGIKTARTTHFGFIDSSVDLLQLPSIDVEVYNLDQAEAVVDKAISLKKTIFLLIHEIVSSNLEPYQYSESDLDSLIAYISKTGVSTLTNDEWYNIVLDKTPPKILSFDPVNKAVNLPFNKTFTVTFSEPIKAGSMWIELANSVGVAVPFTTYITGNVLNIIPVNLLTEDKYTLISHTGSITDLAGNPLALLVSSFSVGNPPTIINNDPVNKAVNLPFNKTFTVTFSEPIKAGSMWIELVNSVGVAIPFTTYINGNVLNIIPVNLLTEDKYTLISHTGSITDLAGNPLALLVSSFSVGNPPIIVSSVQTTIMPINMDITLTMSEPIRAGSLWIQLTSSDGTVIPITASVSGLILTINHATLIPNTKYTLILHTGCITDLAGNPIALTKKIFFFNI